MNRRFRTAVAYSCLATCGSVLLAGCSQGRSAEQFGKTFYLDGAGNWGFGASEVPSGLRAAGYHGDVELYVWTTSLVPIVDQLNIPAARARAALLARRIDGYHRKYPDRSVNVIALSAGTGVATWAIENLQEAKVNNFILLGSSLSNTYDMSRCLRNMTGNIYVYYSPNDQVLEAVKVIGTIDGRRGVASVGSVGLRQPAGMGGRIVNIGWNRSWLRLGWAGAHTDTTNTQFVRHELSKWIVQSGRQYGAAHADATFAAVAALPDGRPDGRP